MKKIVLVFVIVFLITGCGDNRPASQIATLRADVTIDDIVQELSALYPIKDAAPLTAEMTDELLELKGGEVEEFSGSISLSQSSACQIIAIKAVDGKADNVADRLAARQELVYHTFVDLSQERAALAEQGRVIVVGDYVFLLILETEIEDMDAVQEKLMGYFVQ